ncbi:MAG: alanine:cation symporter family protein [Bacteroidales bacterium]|nr:alanine:cation symporter family protein [Bacteroidales bacterium]
MSFSEIAATVSTSIWGMPFIVICLGTGIYFSIRTRFLQVRYLRSMWKMLFQDKSSKDGLSSFQSFVLALSGRVGTGNIVGVATAIALGGPGAIFWMWTIAFLGASTAYIEAALGQIYKEKIAGNYRGGPAYYIHKGLKMKGFAMLFAIVTIVSLGIFLPGVQANAICDAFDNAFGIEKMITAGVVILLLGFVIFGGIKRIAKVAQVATPFMAVGYILVALVILILNIKHIPEMFMLIINCAFGLKPVASGIVGSAIIMGVKRGIFSNEAGQGTAPHAAAAASVSHPVKQGLVQAFSVYVDTLLVCSATAFMILITGMYKVFNTATCASADCVVMNGNGLPDSVFEYGALYTQQAVEVNLPGYGATFVAIALFFFAFTTVMSYYFQAETNVFYLFRKKITATIMINVLRIVMLAATFYTAINAMTLAWDLTDIGVGIMAWLNIIAILLLQRPALRTFKDYERQRKQGIKEPVFDPQKLGISNADEWK